MRTGQRYDLLVKYVKGDAFKDYQETQEEIVEDITVSDARMYISRYVPPQGWEVIRFILELRP